MPEDVGKGGVTALMYAAAEGNIEQVRELLAESDESVDQQDDRGGTSLMYASINGHQGIVRLILDSDANPRVVTKSGRTAQWLAKKQGFDEIVRMLNRSQTFRELRVPFVYRK